MQSLSKVAEDAELFCARNHVCADVSYAFTLCLDELFTNIISYGYKEDASKIIDLELSADKENMTAVIRDCAPKFDPLKDVEDPDISAPLGNRDVGGLGIFFTKKTMDKISYKRENGFNILTLSKRLCSALKS